MQRDEKTCILNASVHRPIEGIAMTMWALCWCSFPRYQDPKVHVQKVENMNLAFELIAAEGIMLVSIGMHFFPHRGGRVCVCVCVCVCLRPVM